MLTMTCVPACTDLSDVIDIMDRHHHLHLCIASISSNTHTQVKSPSSSSPPGSQPSLFIFRWGSNVRCQPVSKLQPTANKHWRWVFYVRFCAFVDAAAKVEIWWHKSLLWNADRQWHQHISQAERQRHGSQSFDRRLFRIAMPHRIAEPTIRWFVCNSCHRALPKSQLSTISSTSGNMSSCIHFFWQKRAAWSSTQTYVRPKTQITPSPFRRFGIRSASALDERQQLPFPSLHSRHGWLLFLGSCFEYTSSRNLPSRHWLHCGKMFANIFRSKSTSFIWLRTSFS